jgi:hypothetical protein
MWCAPIPALSLRIIVHAIANFFWKPADVLHVDEFKWVYPCLQVLCCAVRQEVWVHLLLNGHPNDILICPVTLMTVGIKAHELLCFATVLAYIHPPACLQRQTMPLKH